MTTDVGADVRQPAHLKLTLAPAALEPEGRLCSQWDPPSTN